MENTDVVVDKKTKTQLQTPKNWKVVMINDDFTPQEFVVSLLIEIFRRSPEDAEAIMLSVHNTGSGVAGVYDFEIAEAKSVEATTLARDNRFPLQIQLEEE
jgi:ATP-dependent Clp protease adaptor protein ClpS